MAISYDDWKKQYEALDTAWQQKYADLAKNSDLWKQYMNQYINESKNAGTFGTPTAKSYTNANQSTNTSSSSNSGSYSSSNNGTTYNNNWNNQSDLNNWYSSSTNQWGSSLSDGKNGDGNTYWKFTFDADEFLDTSKFWESNGKITVKEWTAAETGRPDYYAESDARLREMVDNLNTYWQTNPEFFSSREEFNKQFEYNQRESEAQRALLDSYWKKAQDYKKANSYSNWSSFWSDLSSGNVTESEFEALKQYNQKAYLEWQQQMQDKIDLAISNLTIPRSIDNITDALNTLVEKFNLQSWDPYNIIQGWEDMMTRTWAWDAMNQATKLYEEANSDIAKIKEIQSRYSSSTWWTQSDALIAARLQKATLPYETSLANKLSAWQHWQSLYQTKLGTANQYAQTIQMQANEDQRIFNQKIAALWFAVTAYTLRTPEQQAQLWLQTAQIQNNMSLLQQSKQNDLNLYNQYATAKLNNQLAYELTDLTTTDPTQLRANLKNVLDPYYEKFWDIIERSESQVIEDVIALAKEKWISVAEALRENFTKQLMAKDEYANYLKNNYADPNAKYQDSYDWSIDEDWNLKVNYKWYGNLNLTDVQKQALLANKKTYEGSWMKWAWLRNNNPWNIKDTGFWNVLWTDDRWFAIFSCPEDWFDALVDKINNIQNGWSKVYSSNMSLYDFFKKYAPSSDNNNPKAYAESVAKQLWVSANATVWSVDATKLAAAIAKHDSWYDYSTYWQFRTNVWTVTWDKWTRNDWTQFDVWQSTIYNSLNAKWQEAVKQLLNNSLSRTAITKRNWYEDPEWILAAVSEINPAWSESDYNNRKTAEQNWAKLEIWWAISRNATAATAAKRIFDFIDNISDKDLQRTWMKSLNDIMNATSEQLGNPNITRLKTLLTTLQSEAAGALKWWNAAISDQDKKDMADIFSAWMTNSQIKAAMEEMVKLLYDKNETEARSISQYWFYKKNPIWTDDIQDWMYNDLWIDLSVYYNYASPDKYFTEFKLNDSDLVLDSNFISYMEQ